MKEHGFDTEGGGREGGFNTEGGGREGGFNTEGGGCRAVLIWWVVVERTGNEAICFYPSIYSQ